MAIVIVFMIVVTINMPVCHLWFRKQPKENTRADWLKIVFL